MFTKVSLFLFFSGVLELSSRNVYVMHMRNLDFSSRGMFRESFTRRD